VEPSCEEESTQYNIKERNEKTTRKEELRGMKRQSLTRASGRTGGNHGDKRYLERNTRGVRGLTREGKLTAVGVLYRWGCGY